MAFYRAQIDNPIISVTGLKTGSVQSRSSTATLAYTFSPGIHTIFVIGIYTSGSSTAASGANFGFRTINSATNCTVLEQLPNMWKIRVDASKSVTVTFAGGGSASTAFAQRFKLYECVYKYPPRVPGDTTGAMSKNYFPTAINSFIRAKSLTTIVDSGVIALVKSKSFTYTFEKAGTYELMTCGYYTGTDGWDRGTLNNPTLTLMHLTSIQGTGVSIIDSDEYGRCMKIQVLNPNTAVTMTISSTASANKSRWCRMKVYTMSNNSLT